MSTAPADLIGPRPLRRLATVALAALACGRVAVAASPPRVEGGTTLGDEGEAADYAVVVGLELLTRVGDKGIATTPLEQPPVTPGVIYRPKTSGGVAKFGDSGWLYDERTFVGASHSFAHRRGVVLTRMNPPVAARQCYRDKQRDIAVYYLERSITVVRPTLRTASSPDSCAQLGSLRMSRSALVLYRASPRLHAPTRGCVCIDAPHGTGEFWASVTSSPGSGCRQGFMLTPSKIHSDRFWHTVDTSRGWSGAPILAPCDGDGCAQVVGMQVQARRTPLPHDAMYVAMSERDDASDQKLLQTVKVNEALNATAIEDAVQRCHAEVRRQ